MGSKPSPIDLAEHDLNVCMNKKVLLLTVAKRLGAFRVARRLTASGLRILCYHGIAIDDEHEFRGRLFMQEERFRERMRLLQKNAYPVLPLDEALERLRAGTLPPAAVVITFDDGWDGACRVAFPVLRDLGFPATLYVTTYYVEKGTQVFDVAVQYLLWKARTRSIHLPSIVGSGRKFDLTDPRQYETALNIMFSCGKTLATAEERQLLLEALGDSVGIDVRSLAARGVLRFATLAMLRQLRTEGVNLQLHTHRHNLHGGKPEIFQREIVDNRNVLASVTTAPLEHFCYPSGICNPEMWRTLRDLGVLSATTCEPGFNYPETHPLTLKRILDENELPEIEFEAEMSGFLELLRKVRQRIAWPSPSARRAPGAT